jgi:hypothetical protein
MGWYKRGEPDSMRVARTLGIRPSNGVYRQHISYNQAVELCKALHVDYVDIGV